MSKTPEEARPAASVLLLAESAAELEVLMVQRQSGGFFGGLFVFPGGAVDPIDSSSLARRVVPGSAEDQVFRVAALRELAEETGLALTVHGLRVTPPSGGAALLGRLEDEGETLDGDSLHPVSRWVTPEWAPTRFDTRFYAAAAGETPGGVRVDPEELVGHEWVRPSDALERHEGGAMPMVGPTVAHLRWLRDQGGFGPAMAAAKAARGRAVLRGAASEGGAMMHPDRP